MFGRIVLFVSVVGAFAACGGIMVDDGGRGQGGLGAGQEGDDAEVGSQAPSSPAKDTGASAPPPAASDAGPASPADSGHRFEDGDAANCEAKSTGELMACWPDSVCAFNDESGLGLYCHAKFVHDGPTVPCGNIHCSTTHCVCANPALNYCICK